jgi:tetratricopeptide (TPR) repeat protein
MRGRALLVLPVVGLMSCATPAVRVPIAPGEDFFYPVPGAGELTTAERRAADESWRDVLSGSAVKAEQEYSRLIARHPGSVCLETGRGYARLRGGRFAEAARSFDLALRSTPDYVPALVGAASTRSVAKDPEGALELYRRAQAAEPSEARIRRRLAELKVQVTEKCVGEARDLGEKGDRDGAIGAYRRALAAAPELAQIRLELANLLASGGDEEGAVTLLKEDLSQDRDIFLRLGELLRSAHHLDEALDVYHELTSRDPKDEDAQARAAEIRKELEFQGMPEEYRKIYDAAHISRGDLAALLAVKVRPLQRLKEGEAQVAVDISGSWAREHIIKLLALSVMDVYSNHTFQPGAMVRRGDLATAVARVMDLLHVPSSTGPQASDISPSDVRADAVKRAVGAGLMELTPSGAFEAWRPVSGREAADVVEGLVRLVGS